MENTSRHRRGYGDLRLEVKDDTQPSDRAVGHAVQHSDVIIMLSDGTRVRKAWGEIGHMIAQGQLSQDQRRQVIKEACSRAEEQDLVDSILPVLSEDDLLQILETLFARCFWSAIAAILDRDVSNTVSTEILNECLDLCTNDLFSTHILPSCSSGQLELFMAKLVNTQEWDSVKQLLDIVGDGVRTWSVGDSQVNCSLLRLVSEERWQSVGNMLESGVSDSQRQWAVSVTCQRASARDIQKHALPHCADDQLNNVLSTLVTRGLWLAVGRVLHRLVSPDLHIWAIREACEQADDWTIRWCVLPHCADDQLDEVLATLVTRGHWQSVGRVLYHSVSAAQRRRLVQKACEHADDFSMRWYILPHCADDELDDILTVLVSRGLWDCADIILYRIVSPTQHRWVIQTACEEAFDRDVRWYILPHCADDQLDNVMATLARRGLWKSVDALLYSDVGLVKNAWAILQSCQQSDDKDISNFLLPHCADDQLEDLLTRLVDRSLWHSVDILLHRGVSPAQHMWAVREGCQRAHNKDFSQHILPHCTDDQLVPVLAKLVKQGLWRSVDTVLQHGVSQSKHGWAILEACRRAPDRDITQHILPHCADNQLDEVLTILVKRRLWNCVDTALHRVVHPARHSSAIRKACQQANEWDIKQNVLSHCDLNQFDEVLTTLVKRCLWSCVDRVLQCGVSPEKCKWTIRKAYQDTDGKNITKHILPHCTEDQLDDVLSMLVRRRQWKSVNTVLHHGVSAAQRRLAIREACQKANSDDFVQYVLPNCSADQLVPVLPKLVKQGLWKYVNKVLPMAVCPQQHRWAIHEACQRANDHDVTCFIIPYCPGDQLGDVLTTLVGRHLWMSVDKVLRRGVSPSTHKHAVDEASQLANDQEMAGHILPHCADDQLGALLTTLVRRRLWTSMDKVLRRGVGPSKHMHAIHEACLLADDEQITKYILPHCTDDQLEAVLTTLVRRQLWKSVDTVLRRGVNPVKHRWTIGTASEQAEEEDFRKYISPHCTDDQLVPVLPNLVRQGLWEYVKRVLQGGVSLKQLEWTILQACHQAHDSYIAHFILPLCADDQLHAVLATLVGRGMWHSVDTVLHRCVSPAQHRYAIHKACQKADGENFTQHILPHCTDDQLVVVLSKLVRQGLWRSVDTVLQHGVSQSKHGWAILEACRRAPDRDITQHILPHCADNQLDEVLTILVKRRLWNCVDTVLHRVVHPARHSSAIRKACQQANEWDIKQNVLSHCDLNQFDEVLTILVKRGLWSCVDRVLHCGVSPEKRKWTIYKACQDTHDNSMTKYILPHCTEDQRDGVLPTLVRRRLWKSVDFVLRHGVSATQHKLAVREACQQAEGEDFTLYILPHCSAHQLVPVLPKLVKRGFWKYVDIALQCGVSPKLRRWIILEACQHARDCEITQNILPHCLDDQPDEVLPTLVKRRMWTSVDAVLNHGVCPLQLRWTIEKACRHADGADIIKFILPHCAVEQLDDVLSTLVRRHLWKCVDTVLHLGVSPVLHRWAISEACWQVDGEDFKHYILPHCSDDQLIFALPTLVRQGMWEDVDRLLQHGVCPTRHRWAVREACQRANDKNIIEYVLPHCADDQLENVLFALVTRSLWKSVNKVLHRVVSPAHHKWAIGEACQRAGPWVNTYIVLPHCVDNQLDDVLTTLVKRGLWKPVDRALRRGVSPAHHRWAIEEACQRASDFHIRWFILPHCADDQLDDILPTLVTKRLWECVDRVLHRVVSPARHRWAIIEACQQAGSGVITEYILPHCADNQLEDVLKIVVAKSLWQSVSMVLQRGVSVTHHRQALREVLQTGQDLFITWCMLPDYSAERFRQTDWSHGDIWDKLTENVEGFIRRTLYIWATADDSAEFDDTAFWRYVRNPHYEIKHLSKLLTSLRRSRQEVGDKLSSRLDLDSALCSVLYESILHFVTETWVSGLEHTQWPASEVSEQASRWVTKIQEQIVKKEQSCLVGMPYILHTVSKLCCQTTANNQRWTLMFGLSFVKHLIQQCRRTPSNASTDVILNIMTCVPLVLGIQCVALTVMLRHKRWNVIRRADLSGVWEQVRRRLLTAAAKQKQWSLVAQWADHRLYDDQCLEVLEEAYTQKQWRVYLQLADYGTTEIELMRVHYRLTRYAPWSVVLEMFERGADLIECQEGVRPGKNLRILDQEKDDNERRPRYVKLLLLQKKFEKRMKKLKSLEAALKKREWSVALYEINRRHRRKEILLGLRAALTSKVWHVVIYLIRQGIGPRLCDGLFSLMVEIQQWDVCRVLLEEGVDLQLGLAALPQLMEQNQWTLVARLMEYDVGDALRRRVMQQALDRREGSVVWQCIINMEHEHLSVEERQDLFHEAFNRENWQAVKPLVEVKDDTGIQHRDAALLESIEQHQWDVVDHCLLFRAKINMLDEDGHTPNHRMARKSDWEAVEEVTKRGGDPNMLDKFGLSVLHRVIWAAQWELTKLLIECLGDIHQPARYVGFHSERYEDETRTPLQMLIDARQVEVIHHSHMWSPDQGEGVNAVGETALHVTCLTGYLSMLYDLISRQADPLAVTVRGHSALSYAVLCKDRPQQTVAECIRLGFSTQQPRLTDTAMMTDPDNKSVCAATDQEARRNHSIHLLSSPLLLAVMRGLPLVTQMLYESGACSYSELFRLQATLQALNDPEKSTVLEEEYQKTVDDIYRHVRSDDDKPAKAEKVSVRQCVQYVLEVFTTPRSLLSMCRHAISHCLKLHKRRATDVNQLPLKGYMKRYVVFDDLTDPDYGWHDTCGRRREEFVLRHLSEALSLMAEEEEEDAEKTDKKPHVDTAEQQGVDEGSTDDDSDSEDDDDSEMDSDYQYYETDDSEEESDEEGDLG